MRANVFIGFPLGGLLSLAIAGVRRGRLLPAGIQVDTLGQVGLPVAHRPRQARVWRFALLGFFAATFGAACETGLSVGYSIAQYFGWQWGKFVEPLRAARFHTVVLLATIAGRRRAADHGRPDHGHRVLGRVLRGRAAADLLPDPGRRQRPDYMGEHVNGRVANTLGTVYLFVVVVAAVAAIPLMIADESGAVT